METPGLKFFKAHQRKLTILLICIAVIYLLVILAGEQNTILGTITAFPLEGWLFILTLSFVSYIIRFARWLIYARTLGHNLPIIRHFIYYLAGFSLTTTPGKTGESIRALFLTEYRVPIKHTFAMFFSERLLDLVIAIALATLALAIVNDFGTLIFILICIVMTAIYLIHSPYLVQLISWLAKRIKREKLSWLLQQLAHLIENARELLSFKLIFQGLIVGCFAWMTQAYSFYFITQSYSLDISFQYSVAAYSLGVLAGAVSFIPGGIGSSEAVLALLLKLMGVDWSTAIAIALISRLSTIWFMVFTGLCAVTIISFLKPVIITEE